MIDPRRVVHIIDIPPLYTQKGTLIRDTLPSSGKSLNYSDTIHFNFTEGYELTKDGQQPGDLLGRWRYLKPKNPRKS